MTHCNRCGRNFDNFFNGVHWCPYCGKQFMIDENLLKKKEEEKES
jgi:rRNA maturation endonuclease Nob1